MAPTFSLAASSAPAGAARPPPAEAPRQNKGPPPTTVSGVTVVASRTIPAVVSTFPANGATVSPGLLVLRVSYDARMFDESWSYVTSLRGLYPECADTPRLLDDRKSFALICRTMPSKTYAVWFNRGPYDNFISAGRRAAKPYELQFKTSDGDAVWTLKDAMAQDKGLPATANPAEPEGKRKPGREADDPGL